MYAYENTLCEILSHLEVLSGILNIGNEGKKFEIRPFLIGMHRTT